jgi:hypothetical protein
VIQQTLDMKRLMEFAGEAFQNTTLSSNQWDKHPVDLQLSAGWNHRTASFIKAELVVPILPAEIRGERPAARTAGPRREPLVPIGNVQEAWDSLDPLGPDLT